MGVRVETPSISFGVNAASIQAKKSPFANFGKWAKNLTSLIRLNRAAPRTLEADLGRILKQDSAENDKSSELKPLLEQIASDWEDFFDNGSGGDSLTAVNTIKNFVSHRDSEVRNLAIQALENRASNFVAQGIPEVRAFTEAGNKLSAATKIIEAAGSFDKSNVVSMFGNNLSGKAYVEAKLFADEEFTKLADELKLAVLEGKKPDGISETEFDGLKASIANDSINASKLNEATVTLPKTLLQRVQLVDTKFRAVSASSEEINKLGLYKLGVTTGTGGDKSFEFNFADFVTTLHNKGEEAALKKLQAANLILEHRKADELGQETPNNRSLKDIENQQQLLFSIIRDPEILDSTGKVAKRLSSFLASPEGLAQTKDFALRTAEAIAEPLSEFYAEKVIELWNQTYLGEKIDLATDPTKPAMKELQELADNKSAEIKIHNEEINNVLDQRFQANQPDFTKLAATIKDLKTKPEKELGVAERELARLFEITDGIIKVKGDDSNIISMLESKQTTANALALAKVQTALASISESHYQSLANNLLGDSLGIGQTRLNDSDIQRIQTQSIHSLVDSSPTIDFGRKLGRLAENILTDKYPGKVNAESEAIKGILQQEPKILNLLQSKDKGQESVGARLLQIAMRAQTNRAELEAHISSRLAAYDASQIEQVDINESTVNRAETLEVLAEQVSGLEENLTQIEDKIAEYAAKLSAKNFAGLNSANTKVDSFQDPETSTKGPRRRTRAAGGGNAPAKTKETKEAVRKNEEAENKRRYEEFNSSATSYKLKSNNHLKDLIDKFIDELAKVFKNMQEGS